MGSTKCMKFGGALSLPVAKKIPLSFLAKHFCRSLAQIRCSGSLAPDDYFVSPIPVHHEGKLLTIDGRRNSRIPRRLPFHFLILRIRFRYWNGDDMYIRYIWLVYMGLHDDMHLCWEGYLSMIEEGYKNRAWYVYQW